MKALILNSGMGHRMGILTSSHPKCMTDIYGNQTILSRQLKIIEDYGIKDVVITTGYYDDVLIEYCNSLDTHLNIQFVNNPIYDKTNYIYSIYCARSLLDDDIILMHGDLVFENKVYDSLLKNKTSCVVVDSSLPLPKKDFKAVVKNGKVTSIGVEFFDDALACQPIYKLNRKDWKIWINEIESYVKSNIVDCYAEKALNEVTDKLDIGVLDVNGALCNEIDTPDDLENVSTYLEKVENRICYVSFSSQIIHSGHIKLLKEARRLGKVVVGIMTDKAIESYKGTPFVPFEERWALIENLKEVSKVIPQDTLSYKGVIEELKPDYVLHGDDWTTGVQKEAREEVVSLLKNYGGVLVELPYSKDKKYTDIDNLWRVVSGF